MDDAAMTTRAMRFGLALLCASLCSAAGASAVGSGPWIVHQLPPGDGGVIGIAIGPDHRSVWFSAVPASRNLLIRVDANGKTRSIPLGNWQPTSIVFGTDRRVYTTSHCCSFSNGPAVLAVSQNGRITAYLLPRDEQPNDGVVLGPDGNVWFTTNVSVRSISPSGQMTRYPLPAGYYDGQAGISVGVDGKIWFPLDRASSFAYGGLGYIDPKSGAENAFGFPQCYYVEPIVAGTDGNVYGGCQLTLSGPINVARITPSGALTIVSDPDGIVYSGGSEMVATLGKVWFISWYRTSLSELDTRTLRVLQHPVPRALGSLRSIGFGPGRDIWAGSNSSGRSYGIFVR
jgi:streptogramin lyase